MAVNVYRGFEPPSGSTRIWRYFDYVKLESLLTQSAIYFASAREFQDTFEGSISVPDAATRYRLSGQVTPDTEFLAKQISGAFEQLRRLHKISCWHINDSESAAMWRLYLREGRGVAIQSTVDRLRNALKPYRIAPHYGEEDITLGVVRYVDYKTARLDGEGFLGPFFHKRRSYAYEQEFRALLSVRKAEEFGVSVPKKGVFVSVDLPSLVETVYLAPAIDPRYRDDITTLLKQAHLACALHQSELDDEVLY